MDRKEFQRRMGNKIRIIRFQHTNKNNRTMTQKEFCSLLNETDPVEIRIDANSLGMYERGSQNCPGDKLEKIYSLDKNK